MTCRHIRQDGGQSTYPEWVVIGDGNVMLLHRLASQPDVASSLPSHNIIGFLFECLYQSCARKVPRQSYTAMTSSRVK